MNEIVLAQKYDTLKEQVGNIIKSAQNGGGKLLQGGRNEVRWIKQEGGDTSFVVKLFRRPSYIKQLWYSVNPSKAQRSFEYATKLLNLGISTPQPVSYTPNNSLLLGRSSYVSEFVFSNYTFRDLIHDLTIPNRDEILKKFTKFTFKMHENEILFKDHSPGNTLIQVDQNDIKFYLVDLNRLDFKTLNYEERLKNFQRLWPSKYMQQIIAIEYASLSNQDPDRTYQILNKHCEDFKRKKHFKKQWKKKLGI